MCLPASTIMIANQSQSPRLPLAPAAAAVLELVRLWDRDRDIPGSVVVGLDEGLGLKEREGNVSVGN